MMPWKNLKEWWWLLVIPGSRFGANKSYTFKSKIFRDYWLLC
jgi:hypothetical protein